ncbi:MAG: hypothetical protein Q8J79_00935 [Erythrobacter sp.]|nr:hypothetical protein [Erythrobacter sp.]
MAGCVRQAAEPAEPFNPTAPLDGQLYSAIWYDLQSNALIGNGNELAARWMNAGSGNDRPSPQLHIENLTCQGNSIRLKCKFGLFREGSVANYNGQPVTDRLSCNAEFVRNAKTDEWLIPRLPPGPSGGHSRITIACSA